MELEEKEQIETLRGIPSKPNCKTLAKIYAKYTGVEFNTCFCSGIEREKFYKLFYDWYDSIDKKDE